MSTFRKITKHPQTGEYEVAIWHDDYYGSHMYGVEFESDDKVYPEALVEEKQIYDFWKDDVVKAYLAVINPSYSTTDRGITTVLDKELELLNEIQNQYKLRWEKDPETGDGATTKSAILKWRD